MEKQFFSQLLVKYRQKKLSAKETRLLFSYYKLFDLLPEDEKWMEEEEKRQLKEDIKKNIQRKILTHPTPISIGFVQKKWLSVAAALLTIVVTGAIIFSDNKSSVTSEKITSVRNSQKENTLIHLPDGSTVILSVGSKLDFSASFNDLKQRDIYLDGEAFFDISHNPQKPFIVHTGSLATTVLGTAFNIKANAADSQISVIVTRGKVRISNGAEILGSFTKGQEAIYHKSNRNFLQKTVANNDLITWKKQDVLLDDVTVEDAAKLLEERFDVRITFADTTIKSNRFTTVIQRSESIEDIVRGICEFHAAQYKIDKKTNTIIISKHSTTIN